MTTVDQKPGKGTYACMVCDQRVVLEHDDQELQECPKCGSSEFSKES